MIYLKACFRCHGDVQLTYDEVTCIQCGWAMEKRSKFQIEPAVLIRERRKSSRRNAETIGEIIVRKLRESPELWIYENTLAKECGITTKTLREHTAKNWGVIREIVNVNWGKFPQRNRSIKSGIG